MRRTTPRPNFNAHSYAPNADIRTKCHTTSAHGRTHAHCHHTSTHCCDHRSSHTYANPDLAHPEARWPASVFVLYTDCEPTEHDAPRALLEGLGVGAAVASLSSGVVKGARGHEVVADLRLSDVHGGDYDGIVYVGVGGYESEELEGQRVAQEAVAAGKVVAAICVAPLALARAGVLEGKRATVSLGSHLPEEAGVIFTNMAVERDGRIITARSPGDVRHSAEAIAAALAE